MCFRTGFRPDCCRGGATIVPPAGRPAGGAIFALPRQKPGRSPARQRKNQPPEPKNSSRDTSGKGGRPCATFSEARPGCVERGGPSLVGRLVGLGTEVGVTFESLQMRASGLFAGHLKAVWLDIVGPVFQEFPAGSGPRDTPRSTGPAPHTNSHPDSFRSPKMGLRGDSAAPLKSTLIFTI